MGPKPPEEKKKKVKKVLTEEEKRIKAEMLALQAEEMRKKKIRDRRDQIKKHMIDEEKLSKMSMLQIHKDWRKIMRIAKTQDLRKDIEWLSEKHVHQVEVKDTTIATFQKTTDESEAQHQNALSKHLSMLDTLIDLHYIRTKKMEEDFQSHLKRLKEEFSQERTNMTNNHEAQKKEMKDMLAAMKAEFDEALDEKRQEFETMREELKNKNTEDYNVMKISLESGIEELERRIEHTHQTYLHTTEAKMVTFKALVAKDAITARIIEQRMRRLIRLHDTLAYWRVRIATNSKEWEAANNTLHDEKDRINKHYQDLKKTLNKLHNSEHHKLKEISKHVMEATKDLKNKQSVAEYVLKLAESNSKLETEFEKIFPFDPLHCSSIPTIPGTRLDHDNSDKEIVALSSRLSQPHRVVPLARARSMMGMEIPIPSHVPEEPGCRDEGCRFQWSSYALDDAGLAVEELDYLSKFYRRFNKVMLDKMALEMARTKLRDENVQLSSTLGNFLDGLTISERMKTGYNALLMINKNPVSPHAALLKVSVTPPIKVKRPGS